MWTGSFEFPGEYYEIIREDFRDLEAETTFLDSYLPRRGRVLDVGCGTATNLRALNDLGHQCVGIDQSASFIRYARKISPPDVRLVHARASDFTDDQLFDLIFCIFVTLNYMRREELRPFIDKARKMLRPGGTFVVDIGHLLNFADRYQPYVIAHHQHGGVLITRLIVHRVNPHEANWRHEETIIVRDHDGSVSMYANFFDQMVLTVPEVTQSLTDSGFVVKELFGSFRKDPPPPAGRGHLVLVARARGDGQSGS